jgi:hypothetical protein
MLSVRKRDFHCDSKAFLGICKKRSVIKNYFDKFKIAKKLKKFCVKRPDLSSNKIKSTRFGSIILFVFVLDPLP